MSRFERVALNVQTGEPGSAIETGTDRRRSRILVGIILLIVWGLITHGTFAGSGDEPHYVMIAHSLAFDADLDLANNYRDARLIAGGTLDAGAHVIERGGRLRSVHDIGLPLALAPVVRVAYLVAETLGDVLPLTVLRRLRLNKSLLFRHQLSLVMALLTGLLARELFLVIRAIGAGPSAFAWSLLFAVTPPVLSHSFLFFTEIPTALITLFAFRALSVEPARTARMPTLVGALTGFLLLIHARNVGIVAGLTLVAMFAASRRALSAKTLTVFLLAASIGAFARTLVTYCLWGNLVTTPHAAFGGALIAGDIVREIFARATGLLFDREYGLIAYGPVYLLAYPGLSVLARYGDHLARDLFIVVACYLLPVLLPLTNIHGWTGGWSPAARFVVPIAALLWLGVYLYATHAVRPGKFFVAALVIVQVVIDALVWQFPKTLWNDGDGVTAFRWSEWLPTWTDPKATVSFGIALAMAFAFGSLCAKYITQPRSSRKGSSPLSLPRA